MQWKLADLDSWHQAVQTPLSVNPTATGCRPPDFLLAAITWPLKNVGVASAACRTAACQHQVMNAVNTVSRSEPDSWYCTKSLRCWVCMPSGPPLLLLYNSHELWICASLKIYERLVLRPLWRSATDPLLLTDRVCGTVYRRPFATHHCHSLSSLTDSRPTCLGNSCGVCD